MWGVVSFLFPWVVLGIFRHILKSNVLASTAGGYHPPPFSIYRLWQRWGSVRQRSGTKGLIVSIFAVSIHVARVGRDRETRPKEAPATLQRARIQPSVSQSKSSVPLGLQDGGKSKATDDD